jgi:hypothetical protein
MFGATLSLEAAGLADLPKDILVPGVAVFSRRAMPLAAWTNALEIAGAWAHALAAGHAGGEPLKHCAAGLASAAGRGRRSQALMPPLSLPLDPAPRQASKRMSTAPA